MNPYIDINRKIPDRRLNFYINRRKFVLEYIKNKDDIKIMIIGEAPGLDGCGYSGIGFTAEYNAINHLQLKNYHNTAGNLQKEDSADYIYSILEEAALKKCTSIKDFSRNLYFTNSCLCVPLSDTTCTSITKPHKIMKQNCRYYLLKQIEYTKPTVVICLGKIALETMNRMYNFAPKKMNITDYIRSSTTFRIEDMEIIPELHPSPINKYRKQTKDLYLGIVDRLCDYICKYT